MKKLRRFLLIDDSNATNYYNKTILNRSGLVDEVIVAENGSQALQSLESLDDIPEVIFLDLNMPVMDGWEFLEKYQLLYPKNKQSIIVVLIGTKLSPEKESLLKNIPQVKEFRDKMLSKKVIEEIVSKYFLDEARITLDKVNI